MMLIVSTKKKRWFQMYKRASKEQASKQEISNSSQVNFCLSVCSFSMLNCCRRWDEMRLDERWDSSLGHIVWNIRLAIMMPNKKDDYDYYYYYSLWTTTGFRYIFRWMYQVSYFIIFLLKRKFGAIKFIYI